MALVNRLGPDDPARDVRVMDFNPDEELGHFAARPRAAAEYEDLGRPRQGPGERHEREDQRGER